MEIFPSRYVGVFSLQDNNNGFATTHPTCNFPVQSRKLNQWGEKKGFIEKGKWITPELCMRINPLHHRVQFMLRITHFFNQYGIIINFFFKKQIHKKERKNVLTRKQI